MCGRVTVEQVHGGAVRVVRGAGRGGGAAREAARNWSGGRRTRGAESRGGRQRRATGQPRHSVHALPRRRQPAWSTVHHAPSSS